MKVMDSGSDRVQRVVTDVDRLAVGCPDPPCDERGGFTRW
jgi:hypothetical protein